MVRSDVPTRAKGKTYREGAEAKKGSYLVGSSLKPTWLFVIGCP